MSETNKDLLATTFQNVGLKLVGRERMGDYELFLADGMSHAPHLRWQRFGVEPDEFPAGMFVTFWWLGRGEKLHIGRPLFLKLDQYERDWRLNAARADATKALKKLKLRTKH